VAALSMIVLAFVPGIPISLRKIIFISCIYLLSCVLLYYVGLYGPGLLYLQAGCIFSILIFRTRYAYWPSLANTLICVVIGFAIHFRLLPWPQELQNSLAAWIAVCSNLVFLSFLSSALIPRLFNGLQDTVLQENKVRTQLKEEQQALQQTMNRLEHKNEELEQFAYVASHDLQEPLRMITSFLGKLEETYNPIIDEKGKKYIYFTVDAAKRMRQIILDLLDFSRAGQILTNPTDVDMNLLVQDILVLFQNEIKEKNALIRVGKLPVIAGHKAPLRQVLQNLISNALKYSNVDRQPKISIAANEHDLHWEFSVEDNGIGISKDYFERIFIIFQRLHAREEYSGTGLGLAICKKIVETMGGQIWLQSIKGEGTTFYFSIKK
jgi:signal transduction histidine kinase